MSKLSSVIEGELDGWNLTFLLKGYGVHTSLSGRNLQFIE